MASLASLRGTGLAGTVCVLLSLALAPRATAQAAPRGEDFQVNTYTTSQQSSAAVAMHGRGDFVVVWESYGSPGSDDSHYSVQARRYSWDGTPLGPQFQVNSYTFGVQGTPSVAADSQGRFVVAWFGYSAGDFDLHGIQARRFDANGNPLGGELQVNTYSTATQQEPAIAMTPQGDFVVAWVSEGSSGTDTSLLSVQAQRFDSEGTALGGQFQVNTYTTGNQALPGVAVDSSGGFVVVWHSDGSTGNDTSGASIQGRRYAANGTPLGGQFQVNTYTPNTQTMPAVAVDPQGNFIVAWQSTGSSGSDTSGFSIQAQLFGPDGTPSGGQFQVNTYTTSDQKEPRVAVDARGMVMISWTSQGSFGTDGTGLSIQGRRYRANGAALGPQGQVNSFTTGNQEVSAVAVDPLGDLVVVWQSTSSGGTDTDLTSIQARIWDGVLRDGFETGDTSRWSSTVP